MVSDGADLATLPHIGKSTAEEIVEMLDSGTCQRLEELQRKILAGLTALMKVPQLGPRRAKLLYDKLRITSIDELRAACEAHRVRKIRSFGERTEQNILRGLATVGAGAGRMLLKPASDHVEVLGRHLDRVKAIKRWEVAGSFRRRSETVGDLDVLVQARDRSAATEAILKFPGIERVPELREDRGEIDAASHRNVPKLIDVDDMRGDLPCHTNVTDGAHTVRQMAEAARDRGYEYLAITDHSKALTVAKGLDEARLKKHARQIRELDGAIDGLWLLAGVEVDILKDGNLDLDEDALRELDWVVASVHSHFDLGKAAMTRRIVHAARSGVVHCIGHPGERIIGRRDPIDVDWDELFAACRESGVRLEINAQPDRLDLRDVYCQRAKEAGVGFVVNTDAHKQDDLEFMPFGVGVARRGWLERGDVLNTLPARQLRQALGKEAPHARRRPRAA